MLAASRSGTSPASGPGLIMPLLTSTFAIPRSRTSRAVSITNSMPTSGSLYV